MKGLAKVTRLIRYLRERGSLSFGEALSIRERAFLSTYRYRNLANNESIYMYINNPVGSEQAYAVSFTPRASRETLINISRGSEITEETPGEDNPVPNLRERSDREFSGDVRIATPDNGGVYTHNGGFFMTNVIPGGGAGAAASAQTIEGFGIGISEESQMLIELRNESGNTTSALSMKVEIFEYDASVVTNDRDPDDLTDW